MLVESCDGVVGLVEGGAWRVSMALSVASVGWGTLAPGSDGDKGALLLLQLGVTCLLLTCLSLRPAVRTYRTYGASSIFAHIAVPLSGTAVL